VSKGGTYVKPDAGPSSDAGSDSSTTDATSDARADAPVDAPASPDATSSDSSASADVGASDGATDSGEAPADDNESGGCSVGAPARVGAASWSSVALAALGLSLVRRRRRAE
jgi:hypothetical protein